MTPSILLIHIFTGIINERFSSLALIKKDISVILRVDEQIESELEQERVLDQTETFLVIGAKNLEGTRTKV